jgi:hypothetical protein
VSNVDAIYITIAAPDATREPTLAEYELMTNHTADYFDAYFTGYYYDDADSSFFRTEPILKDTLYDAGVRALYRVQYMEFFANLVFSSAFVLPTSDEAFALVSDSISADYILDFVRSATTRTPFDSTNEVVLKHLVQRWNPR